MRFGTLDVIAPALTGEEFNEAEMLGSAVWLWMHSASHRDAPLQLLPTLLLPAIKSRQFVIASENGKPVFYLAWASMNEEAERRYIDNPPQSMPVEDWTSGDRIWMLDWIAPFGHTRQMYRIATRHLFVGACAHWLHHRGEARGLRVVSCHGMAVTREEAHHWFEAHPLATDRLPEVSQ